MFWVPDPSLWKYITDAPVAEWQAQAERHAAFVTRRNAELAQKAADEAAIEEQRAARWAEIEREAQYMAEMLPLYLHNVGISYKRTVQDRKFNGEGQERIEYVTILDYQITEDAYYFWISTFLPERLPYTVRIANFMEQEVWDTLSSNFGSRCWCEYSPDNGLWVCVERRAGRGQVPAHVSYHEALQQMPKSAPPLTFPIGYGINKRPWTIDLDVITNLLIGGSQGGGKSNMVNVMITTLISRNTPDQLRLFLADFKRVEFAFYKGIPHLGGDVKWLPKVEKKKKPAENEPAEEAEEAVSTVAGTVRRTLPIDSADADARDPLGRNVATDGNELIKLLDYALAEIERRTTLMEGKVKKIGTWNKRYPGQRLSRWLIVVDELADVMLQPALKRKIEPSLIRIAQLGRAVGIHLILATQTPKSEVVTMLIQNNIINRLAFRCGTGIASGVMLDGLYNASRLPQIPGRMIFRTGSNLYEIQAPEITELTIRDAVEAAKKSAGKVAAVVRSIPPDVLFRYALENFGGECQTRELYPALKQLGATQKDIEGILKDYEAKGDPPSPEIELNGDLYLLAPYDKPRRIPRKLILARDFVTRDSIIKDSPNTGQPDPQNSQILPVVNPA